MIRRRSLMRLDDKGQELMDDTSRFFDLVVNDVTGAHRNNHALYIPSHWHRELELFVLQAGKAHIRIGEQLYEARTGDGFFINSQAPHAFAFTQGPVEYRSFLFDPDIVGGAPGSVFDIVYMRPLAEQGPPALRFSRGEGDAAFFEEFDRVVEACIQEAPGYEMQVRTALSQLVLLVRQRGQVQVARRVTEAQEERLKATLRWVEAHLAEHLTLKDIAAQGSMCPRACQKAFQRYMHCSPMEYLQRRRLFAAAERLTLTDDPVTAIALDCGFSSPSYFSKQFKSQTGSTPVEYRLAAQNALRG